MKLKKILPILLLIVMAAVAIIINRYRDRKPATSQKQTERRNKNSSGGSTNTTNSYTLDRTASNLFFTKHARCRMKCRHITQNEVKEILINGTINYKKSDLNDPQGSTYAVEGVTNDRQRVRIIFAPKLKHLTVVTVIDLDYDYECNCT